MQSINDKVQAKNKYIAKTSIFEPNYLKYNYLKLQKLLSFSSGDEIKKFRTKKSKCLYCYSYCDMLMREAGPSITTSSWNKHQMHMWTRSPGPALNNRLVISRSKIRNSWWHLIREHLFTALRGLFLLFMLIDLFHVSTSSVSLRPAESLL